MRAAAFHFSKGVVADAACRLVLRIERDGPFLGRLPRDSMKGPVMSAEVAEVKVPFKVALSSFLGNFLEWFDYATYTYFAITIGVVFFPESAVDST
ncbi:MAG: hypothetical protein ACLT98_10900 [Eggerthellaceae bacterium]